MTHGRTSEGTGPAPADDPLKRLGERLEQASDAAERLMDEAAARIADRVKPPPSGWQTQEQADAPARPAPPDLVLLLRSLGEFIPDDLQHRLSEAISELLMAIRALIDWYLERLQQRRAEPVQVQDIPVL